MTYTASETFARFMTDIVDNAASSKRDRDRDLGVSVYLTRVQSGRCFDCGTASDSLEFAHFTRGDGRAVAVDGALLPMGAMACRRCNLIHDGVTSALGTEGTLPVGYFTTRGIVAVETVLPSRAELVRMAREHRDATDTGMADDIAAVVASLA